MNNYLTMNRDYQTMVNQGQMRPGFQSIGLNPNMPHPNSYTSSNFQYNPPMFYGGNAGALWALKNRPGLFAAMQANNQGAATGGGVSPVSLNGAPVQPGPSTGDYQIHRPNNETPSGMAHSQYPTYYNPSSNVYYTHDANGNTQYVTENDLYETW